MIQKSKWKTPSLVKRSRMVAAVGLPHHHHQRLEWLSAGRSLGSVSAGVGMGSTGRRWEGKRSELLPKGQERNRFD